MLRKSILIEIRFRMSSDNHLTLPPKILKKTPKVRKSGGTSIKDLRRSYQGIERLAWHTSLAEKEEKFNITENREEEQRCFSTRTNTKTYFQSENRSLTSEKSAGFL